MLLLALAAVSVLSVGGVVSADASPAAQPPAAAVRVATAAEVRWPRSVSVPGTVSAVEVATLASRSGGRVTRVDVTTGSHVKKGALIADVGLTDAQDTLAQAQANLTSQQAILNAAEASNTRYTRLYDTHAASQEQYQSAHRAYLTAKASVASAASALANARNNLTYAEIRAPFDGLIAEKNIEVGDFVGGGTPLLVVVGDTPKIRAHVSPAVYGALAVGDKASVLIDGKSLPAVISVVSASADPATHTHLVELRLGGAARATYGAYADVRFDVGEGRVLAVPESALVRRAGLLGVFIAGTDGHAAFRLVRAGARQGGMVAIAAGLAPGDKVIVAPPPGLMNGSPIKAHPAAAADHAGKAAHKAAEASRG